ncbi:MAG: hypothetical protein HF314_16150 [Ignavibacteria bacterium]|jgi:hypothetical protein|nr:hypothetical protein [Ignavibacteria bacterium]MCU7504614.1 hypothetical protein [Ignavibacteria bacterium]MCU7517970.1 hypothetical protein [Ignavibacteria bacterium]
MKKLTLTLLFLILSSVAVMAQEKAPAQKDQQDKTVVTDEKKARDDHQDGQKPQGLKHRFVDENGDGVDDNAPGRRMRMGQKVKGNGNGKGKGMDSFVDKDGDGINDNRASGMGWQGKGRKGGLGRHGK